MKPMKFDEATVTLSKPNDMTDAECGPLPIYRDKGRCLSCWSMTWRERFSALFFGRTWLWVRGDTQPAVALKAARTVFTLERVV